MAQCQFKNTFSLAYYCLSWYVCNNLYYNIFLPDLFIFFYLFLFHFFLFNFFISYHLFFFPVLEFQLYYLFFLYNFYFVYLYGWTCKYLAHSYQSEFFKIFNFCFKKIFCVATNFKTKRKCCSQIFSKVYLHIIFLSVLFILFYFIFFFQKKMLVFFYEVQNEYKQ